MSLSSVLFSIPNVTPCSDMAGEVLAVGETVKEFKIGDRVCANFTSDHVYADATEEVTKTSLGGQSHGVLTQCRSFPAHVRSFRDSYLFYSLRSCSIVTRSRPQPPQLPRGIYSTVSHLDIYIDQHLRSMFQLRSFDCL